MGHEVLEAFESRIGHHPFAPWSERWIVLRAWGEVGSEGVGSVSWGFRTSEVSGSLKVKKVVFGWFRGWVSEFRPQVVHF